MLDNEILRNCDESTIRSLNGCRVTDMILELVKNENKQTFELALRAIRLWAKNRGVYSNVQGYFGGITWAIMIARTVMDNPKMAAN